MANKCGNDACRSLTTQVTTDRYFCLVCGTQTDFNGKVVTVEDNTEMSDVS